MKRNSTFVVKAILVLTISTLSILTAKSQIFGTLNCTAPAMTWESAVLQPGTAHGLKGAKYKFSNVTPGVYAIIEIKDIIGGATLTSIDDMTYGYNAAWQPVVKTPLVQGASESHIEFGIRFYKHSNNNSHKYDCAQLSFIDVDGDSQHVTEYVAAKGYDSYTISPISILSIVNISGMLKATGTVGNFLGLDTTSYRTNINFRFKDCDKIDKVWVGNKTDASFTVQDRYTCGYFKQISMPFQILLPVKYVSFDAAVANKTVLLNWITNNEVMHDHFEVERSFDGTNYKTAGLVMDAIEVAGDSKTYKFKDNAIELQSNDYAYYRLKQIDKDGKFTYSNVIMVRLKSVQNDNVKMTVSPNPFAENLTVRFEAANSGIAEMRIMSMAGQTILNKQSNIIKGSNNLQVENLGKLNAGVYIVQLSMNGTIISNQKIVKN